MTMTMTMTTVCQTGLQMLQADPQRMAAVILPQGHCLLVVWVHLCQLYLTTFFTIFVAPPPSASSTEYGTPAVVGTSTTL